MNKRFKLFRLYSLRGIIELFLALLIDKFRSFVPKRIFLTKNILDSLINAGAFIRIEQNQFFVALEDRSYYIRKEGSDLQVFNQIVLGKGVDIVLQKITELKIDRPHILDCGANIGLASIVLKSAFPDASIIAIEPDKENFSQMVKNFSANNYNEIVPLMAGVWYEPTKLSITNDFRDGSNWAYALKRHTQSDHNTISVDTPQNFALSVGWKKIDVLKIDIEGSEFTLFENLNNWKEIFNTVRIISIEPHSECGNPMDIIKLLLEHNFKLEFYQELIVGTREL